MILVDSNIWLDVITQDATWFDWSSDALKRALIDGVGINQIILAEISAGFVDAEAAKQAIQPEVALLNLPWDAAHLAGSAFRRYRQQHRGKKMSPISDFYIYAHCAIDNMPLLTRDRGKQPYFPHLTLIHPEVRPEWQLAFEDVGPGRRSVRRKRRSLSAWWSTSSSERPANFSPRGD